MRRDTSSAAMIAAASATTRAASATVRISATAALTARRSMETRTRPERKPSTSYTPRYAFLWSPCVKVSPNWFSTPLLGESRRRGGDERLGHVSRRRRDLHPRVGPDRVQQLPVDGARHGEHARAAAGPGAALDVLGGRDRQAPVERLVAGGGGAEGDDVLDLGPVQSEPAPDGPAASIRRPSGVNSCAVPPAATTGSAASCRRSQRTSSRRTALDERRPRRRVVHVGELRETTSSSAWLTAISRAASWPFSSRSRCCAVRA